MADQRVHPIIADPPPSFSSAATSSQNSVDYPKPPNPPPSKPLPPPPSKPLSPPPATYVVQLPREQIFRYPPPENARKFEALTRRKKRRSCCRRFCCFTMCILLLLVIAAAVSAGVLYLVFRFKSPKYTVTNFAIKGMNLTSTAPVSPGFEVIIRAQNPNEKMGIYYLKNSDVNVFYNDVKLSDGVLPAFYQPKKNLTMIPATLTGSDVVLGGTVKTALRNAQNRGRVPFVLNLKAPVKFKVGSAKTWEITVKVKCDIVMDGVNEKANIVSKKCDYSVRLW